MKIAVTGATGFIGRHVLEELHRRGIDTIAISRSQKNHNMDTFKNTSWVSLDINHPIKGGYDKLGRPDVLIHLAWGGLPNYHSLHHFESELPIHYQFLSTLIREGLKNLVAVGTCFEYGMQSGPLSADRETKPINPYGFAKDTLHKQLCYLKHVNPFHFTWARLFYLYGEGQAKNSLFPSLKKAVSLGQKTFDMSHGEQLRDYLPVQEVAKQLVDVALSNQDRGAINICSGFPISVRRLVESWIVEYGWNIKLHLGTMAYPEYEPISFWGIRSSGEGDENI